MAGAHLVILKKPYLDAILAGRKTVESRLLKTRRAPVGCVQAGDRLFLKLSCGPVCGVAIAQKVLNFSEVSPEKISRLSERYNKYILAGQQYWRDRASCKYAVLVWLVGVRAISPVSIDKRDLRGWVVLKPGADFGLCVPERLACDAEGA